jgi:hypothetical protein
MTSLGALVGFFVGHLDLQSLPGLHLLGNQFQDLSAIVSTGLIFLHIFVSLCIQERRLVVDENTVTTAPRLSITQIIRFIRTYTMGLPRRIKTIVSHFIIYSMSLLRLTGWYIISVGSNAKPSSEVSLTQQEDRGLAGFPSCSSVHYGWEISIVASTLLKAIKVANVRGMKELHKPRHKP